MATPPSIARTSPAGISIGFCADVDLREQRLDLARPLARQPVEERHMRRDEIALRRIVSPPQRVEGGERLAVHLERQDERRLRLPLDRLGPPFAQRLDGRGHLGETPDDGHRARFHQRFAVPGPGMRRAGEADHPHPGRHRAGDPGDGILDARSRRPDRSRTPSPHAEKHPAPACRAPLRPPARRRRRAESGPTAPPSSATLRAAPAANSSRCSAGRRARRASPARRGSAGPPPGAVRRSRASRAAISSSGTARPDLLADELEDALGGEAGKPVRQLFRRDLVADLAQDLAVHARREDFGIDQHAVAIEDDAAWAPVYQAFAARQGRRLASSRTRGWSALRTCPTLAGNRAGGDRCGFAARMTIRSTFA